MYAPILSDHADFAQLMARRDMPVLAQVAVRWAYYITLWSLRYSTRKQLQKLSPRQLDDIGLTPREAMIEYSKPFWRP
ncbi:hypothetical protein ROA7450_01683 [Roseovarius albus]|uniref:YjiS-like domain-containing protein n=1 Tax=Roseovarius albus TaxID=1247867 RepID=A0A1X6YZ07_9RHOB|nr:DUF1127 domain-containing protein [Roseovarius albus]SLN35800.1 hypothetical protein ROA7450_01683 [Roseovarius albus]